MPPIHLLLDVIFIAILPALITAALVTTAVIWLGDVKQAPAGAALGLLAGAALGVWLRGVYPLTPPADIAWNRLPWAALIALCVGRVAYLADVHHHDGWLLRGAAALGIAWWVIPESNRDEIVWLAPALAAVIWANWMLLELAAASPGSSSVAAVVILSLFAAGGVLIHAGIGKFLDVTLVLAAALAGVLVVAFFFRTQIGAVLPALAVVLPTLLLTGQQTTAVTAIHWSVYALPALAPLTLAATLPCTHWPKARLHALRIVLVLIPVVMALILARVQGGPLDVGEPE